MQKLQLSIPQPCHENWQNMTAREQGRFCNACAKEVVDFSKMTDAEVLNYFTGLTHQNVCGRVLPSQLERTISYPQQIKKKMFWYWNYIVMFFMFFSKANTTKAQGKIETPVALNPVKRSQLPNGEILVTVAGSGKNAASKKVTGKVIDEKNNPVPFASIMIKDSKTGVVADEKGLFTINVDDNTVLVISALGFKTNIMAVNNKTALNVVLNTDLYNTVLGGISFTGLKHTDDNIINDDDKTEEMNKVKQLDTVTVKAAYPINTNQALFGVMGGVRIRRTIVNEYKEAVNKTTDVVNNLKVYPNPASHGNSINLKMNLTETGLHQLQITDAGYRTVFYKRISVFNKQQEEQIVCDSKWAAGIYFIRIFDSKNSLVNESSFIVQ